MLLNYSVFLQNLWEVPFTVPYFSQFVHDGHLNVMYYFMLIFYQKINK